MEQDMIKALYLEKAPVIVKYLVKNGCTKEDAEDIVQDTFIKAMSYMVHLEEKNISAWLFKVAINQYYDRCRKTKRHPHVELDEEHLMHTLVEEEVGIKQIVSREQSEAMKTVLESLSPTYKNLLLMKYEMDLSYKQIAELVDMPETKVKTYLQRARAAFKKAWKGNDYE